MTVTSFADWVRLPEPACPRIGDDTRNGSVYMVYKVGILAIPVADIPLPALPGVLREAGRYMLPTAELQFGEDRELCKLPLQLSNWALDLVALTQATGENPFPAQVEFGVLNGCHYAEML